MSIKIMTQVWEHSKHKGSDLLLLLAIADHADDEGVAYPGVPALAKKCRMTERNVQHSLRRLRKSAELTVHPKAGPRQTNLYKVKSFHHISTDSLSLNGTDGEKFSGVKSFRGEKSGTQVVKPASPESSLKPSGEKKEFLTETLSGTGTEVAIPEKKPRRQVKPLATDDWIWEHLLIYRSDFDIDALNDDEWWANLANSFPDFSQGWVKGAFASLARWLLENLKRRPRSARGWKTRMSYSLNWYYDKHIRRESYGRQAARQGTQRY